MTTDISAKQLAALLEVETTPFLLDVRESDELEVSVLPGVHHIPMGQVPDRLGEIPKDQPVVVICRIGGRSGKIAEYLAGLGYSNLSNLVGGMNGYATDVDPTLTVY